MIQNLNEQKAKLKENLSREIDEYFEAIETSSSQESFDINRLEQLMLENQRKLKMAMSEANSELASNVDAGVKKLPEMREPHRKDEKSAAPKSKNHVRRVANITGLLLLPGLRTRRSAVG